MATFGRLPNACKDILALLLGIALGLLIGTHALGQFGQQRSVSAVVFSSPGKPDVVFIWRSAASGQAVVITVENEAGETRKQYEFDIEPNAGTWGGMTYSLVIVPEGFQPQSVLVETYQRVGSERIEVER